jgi:hypothetical protein
LETSVQVPPEVKGPESLEENVTLPAGELGIAAVSVTVTAHRVDPSIGINVGEQLITVVVESAVLGITERLVMPELGAVAASPA